MTDFPDRNLDVLRERTASMTPGRHSLTDDEVKLSLPTEPTPDKIVAGIDSQGREYKTWYPCTEGWLDGVEITEDMDDEEIANVLGDATSWAWVVADAIGQQYSLVVRSR